MATAPRIPELAACSADELRTLVIELLERNAKLECGFQRKAARYSDFIAATIPT
jgi:hypothetical protein